MVNNDTFLLGFDPGVSGAIALLSHDNQVWWVDDMPAMPKLSGKGNWVNPEGVDELINQAILDADSENKKLIAVVENVHSMPGDGGVSGFSFGVGFGVLITALMINKVQFAMVSPRVWKKKFELIKLPKDAARIAAINLHPEVALRLKRKKDCDRADAILIAESYAK